MTFERPKVERTWWVLLPFWLRHVLPPRRRALFQHLNFQRCSENVALHILTPICASFNFSILRPQHGSAPVALASLLITFRPSGATKHRLCFFLLLIVITRVWPSPNSLINLNPKNGPFLEKNCLPSLCFRGVCVSWMEGNTNIHRSILTGVYIYIYSIICVYNDVSWLWFMRLITLILMELVRK